MKTMTKIVNSIKIRRVVSTALITTMALTMMASCDENGIEDKTENQDTSRYEETLNEEQSSETEEESIEKGELVTVESYEKEANENFGFGYMFEGLDFVDLYNSTEGREYVEIGYVNFLKNVEERGFFYSNPYISFCWFMNDLGPRYNVSMDLPQETSSELWSHSIVSTADDFAILSQNSENGENYITGFVNGKLYDDAHMMGSEDYNYLSTEIYNKGYDEVMNSVRDEFWGWLSQHLTSVGTTYYIGLSGSVINLSGQASKDPANYKNIIEEMNVYKSTGPIAILATIVPEYDIPDNYLDQYLNPSSTEMGD